MLICGAMPKAVLFKMILTADPHIFPNVLVLHSITSQFRTARSQLVNETPAVLLKHQIWMEYVLHNPSEVERSHLWSDSLAPEPRL